MDRYFNQVSQVFKKLYWKAIFSGVIVDLFLSLIIIPIAFVILGISDEHLYFAQMALFFGLVSIAIGGYVVARFSPLFKVLNAVIFGVLEIIIGFLISIFVLIPTWFHVTSIILIIPASLLGAFVVLRFNRNEGMK